MPYRTLVYEAMSLNQATIFAHKVTNRGWNVDVLPGDPSSAYPIKINVMATDGIPNLEEALAELHRGLAIRQEVA